MSRTHYHIPFSLVVCLLFILIGYSNGVAQSKTRCLNMETENSYKQNNPCLLTRFEKDVGPYALGEVLSGLLNDVSSSNKLVIRVCSSNKLLPSLALTTVPFRRLVFTIKRFFVEDKPQILVTNHSSCISPNSPTDGYAVELWAVKGNSPLPQNNEQVDLENIEIVSLNFDQFSCYGLDYAKQTKRLIRKMKIDSKSYAGIVGGYLTKSSYSLVKSVSTTQNILKRSGLNSGRYLVGFKRINGDGEDKCLNKEPTQPMIFFIAVKSSLPPIK